MNTIAGTIPWAIAATASAAPARVSVPANADALLAAAGVSCSDNASPPDVASPVAPPAPAIAPSDPTSLEEQRRIDGRKLIDELKRRSTLIGAVQPVTMFGGLAQHPLQTWDALASIGSAAARGDLSTAGAQIGDLGQKLTHPDGIAGGIYRGTLFLETGAGAAIGGLEVYHGVKNKDKLLGLMGGADLLSAGSALAFALSGSAPAFGLGMASTATKVGLVLARSKEYSRIQKVKVLTDAAGSVTSLMLKAGVMPLPALIGNAIIGPGQLLYLNSTWVQKKVDNAIAWVAHRLPHRQHAKQASA